MGILKRGRTWYVRYWVNGKEKWKAIGPSKSEARKELNKKLTELGRRYNPPPQDQQLPPDFLDQFLHAKNKDSLVYFIQAGDSGPIKIGIAMNLLSRIKHLQSQSPLKLNLLATIEGGLPKEREIHKRFSAHRLHGEWFSPGEELLKFISDLNGKNQTVETEEKNP